MTENSLSASGLLDILVCPLTGGPLRYDVEAEELVSLKARLAYPVRDGVPILLEEEARALSEDEITPRRGGESPSS